MFCVFECRKRSPFARCAMFSERSISYAFVRLPRFAVGVVWCCDCCFRCPMYRCALCFALLAFAVTQVFLLCRFPEPQTTRLFQCPPRLGNVGTSSCDSIPLRTQLQILLTDKAEKGVTFDAQQSKNINFHAGEANKRTFLRRDFSLDCLRTIALG